jgi:hypothetical protein
MLWGEVKEDNSYPLTSPGGAYKNASWCGAFDIGGQRASDLPGPSFSFGGVLRQENLEMHYCFPRFHDSTDTC